MSGPTVSGRVRTRVARTSRRFRSSLLAGHREVVDGEAGAREQVFQLDRVPEGEASTREVVVGSKLALAGEHLERQDAVDPQDSVQVGEHHGQVGGGDVLEALVRPDAAERRP